MAVMRAFLLLLVCPSSLHLSLGLSAPAASICPWVCLPAYWTLLDTPTWNSTGMLFHRLLLLLVPFVMWEGSEVMVSVSAQIHVRVHLFSWLWTGPCLNL